MWNIILDWTVTLSGAIVMAQIIGLAYRYALSPTWADAGRRKALLAASLFLSVCLLMAAAVVVWHGPIHLHPDFQSLLLALCLISPMAAVLGGWVRTLKRPAFPQENREKRPLN